MTPPRAKGGSDCRHLWTTIPRDILATASQSGLSHPTWYVGRTTTPYCRDCGLKQADAPPKPKLRCRWFGHDFEIRGWGVPVFCNRCGVSREVLRDA